MIIVVGGIKGGSGKTTIATNIAIMRSYEKPNIWFCRKLFVSLNDPQEYDKLCGYNTNFYINSR